MRIQSVDPDLQKLAEMIEACSEVAQKKDHRFLDYLLGMARMELQNIAAGPPSQKNNDERRAESV